MWVWKWAVSSSVIVAAVLVVACGPDQGDEPPPSGNEAAPQAELVASYADITVERLQEILAEGDPFLVNVHIPFEGDLPATDASIPFDQIAEHLDRLPQARDAEIVLYCRSGRMSAEAAQTLASLGYTNVSNLVGGFRAWEAAGLELLSTPGGQ